MQHTGGDKRLRRADLRHAIGEGKLTAAFQPIYDLAPLRLAGFEALARWEHPIRGPVSPAVFITPAEESGHIVEVTRRTIEHALAQLGRWPRERPNTGICRSTSTSPAATSASRRSSSMSQMRCSATARPATG